MVQLEKPSKIVQKEVLNAPLSKREQDRLEREAAYEQTNKEVSKWTNIVKKNREADHIVFNNDEQKNSRTNASLTTHFKVSKHNNSNNNNNNNNNNNIFNIFLIIICI